MLPDKNRPFSSIQMISVPLNLLRNSIFYSNGRERFSVAFGASEANVDGAISSFHFFLFWKSNYVAEHKRFYALPKSDFVDISLNYRET